VCVTATRGELGSPDPDRWPPGEALAKIRTTELDAALGVLGVSEHSWLDYPDGGCAAVPLGEGAERVRDMLERVRPDTVLTFGPDGMTGHSDHQTVGGWVTAAVGAWTGPPPQVLWATNTPGWLAEWLPRLDELGVFMGAEPPSTPRDELRSHVLLSSEERDLKVRALSCQVSQLEPLIQALGADAFRESMSQECYRSASF
jgi:LmbE family N-acetylglucosaminyl deacetylase